MVTKELERLKAKLKTKGFKIKDYESPIQYNIIIHYRNGDYCFSRIFTGENIKERTKIKEEACERMRELIKNY